MRDRPVPAEGALRRAAAALFGEARKVGRRVRESPTITLAWTASVVLAFLAAALYSETGAAGLASALLVDGAGALLGSAWLQIAPACRSAPVAVSRAGVYLAVLIAGLWLFGSTILEAADHTIRDWGPHHALAARLTDALAGGRAPRWLMGVGSGEAPYDLYPSLTSYLAAGLALALDAREELPQILFAIGGAAHVLIALGVARLALRLTSAPWALAAGLLMLFDAGGGSHGGSKALLYWGILHHGVSLVFLLAAFASVLDALRRPRLGTSVAIWIFTALATAAHPSALPALAAAGAALLSVALLARDAPPRRALAALLHLCVGAALGAVVWAPLGERLLAYGVHYGTAARAPWELFQDWLGGSLPLATADAAVYAGCAGAVFALFARRAAPIFVAAAALALLVAVSDLPYLLFNAGPAEWFARFSPVRLLSTMKPLLYACAAYLGGLCAAELRRRWSAPSRGARVAAGAIAALLVAAGLRALLPAADRLAEEQREPLYEVEVNDPEGFADLVAWARARAGEVRPDAYARLAWEGAGNAIYHLHAETGLPALTTAGASALFLRERILDASEASLRRFNVRWVVSETGGRATGEPERGRRFGAYTVREVEGWDGRFARLERGEGELSVSRLEDERVDVVLRGTREPALVTLGTGYYPRWRARHESGRKIPIFAAEALPEKKESARVVAAWIPPGVTTFTPDGALPSDGAGRPLALFGLLLGGAIIAIWSRPRWRRAALRKLALLRRAAPRPRPLLLASLAAVASGALLVAAAAEHRRPVAAFQLGNGAFRDSGVVVEARHPKEAWRRCDYKTAYGGYHCEGLVLVADAVEELVRGKPPSWPYVNPVVKVWPMPDAEEAAEAKPRKVEVKITAHRLLRGSYWAAARGGRVHLEVEGTHRARLAEKRRFHYSGAEREIQIEARVGKRPVYFALVQESALEPERDAYAPPPPPRPPEGVREAASVAAPSELE